MLNTAHILGEPLDAAWQLLASALASGDCWERAAVRVRQVDRPHLIPILSPISQPCACRVAFMFPGSLPHQDPDIISLDMHGYSTAAAVT
jgi:hypothetical protein